MKAWFMTAGVAAIGVLSLCPLCKAPAGAASVAPHAATTVIRPVALVLRTVTLRIKGMTCGGCVFGVRKVLIRLAGVTRADVSYEKGEATVTYDDTKVTVEQMVAAVKTLGYAASVSAPAHTS